MSTRFNVYNLLERAFLFSTEKDLSTVRLCERLKVAKKNGLYKLDIINISVVVSLKIDALLLLVICSLLKLRVQILCQYQLLQYTTLQGEEIAVYCCTQLTLS